MREGGGRKGESEREKECRCKARKGKGPRQGRVYLKTRICRDGRPFAADCPIRSIGRPVGWSRVQIRVGGASSSLLCPESLASSFLPQQ